MRRVRKSELPHVRRAQPWRVLVAELRTIGKLLSSCVATPRLSYFASKQSKAGGNPLTAKRIGVPQVELLVETDWFYRPIEFDRRS